MVDDNGIFVNREEYYPYGETSFGSFARKRFRFTGKEQDEESGMYYHDARYYAAWLARWSSADPIGLGDGLNLFAYTRNNPVNRVDLFGKDTKPVVKTDNYRELLRKAIEEHKKQTITEESLDQYAAIYLKSSEAGKTALLPTDPIAASFKFQLELFGRTTVKLKDFNPPGWIRGARDICFSLANAGALMTAKPGETVSGKPSEGGGGVVLYEKVARRIETDKTASDLALAQIKRHIDSGRALIAGVNEPANPRVVHPVKQPVTDHFVDIYGYETDIYGNTTRLYAKDNAVEGSPEITFIVNADGSITKPAENRPAAQDYINQVYQLSEVRFNSSLPYTGELKPTNDAKQIMYWPHK